MPDTRLILIEGFPGAGKSTTTQHIGKMLQQRGTACRWYLEEDESNPIACLDFEIKGLPEKMIPLWTSFVEGALPESTGTLPWIPSKPKRGTLDRRWGVVMNGEI